MSVACLGKGSCEPVHSELLVIFFVDAYNSLPFYFHTKWFTSLSKSLYLPLGGVFGLPYIWTTWGEGLQEIFN